jgi:hypothetical protein
MRWTVKNRHKARSIGCVASSTDENEIVIARNKSLIADRRAPILDSS